MEVETKLNFLAIIEAAATTALGTVIFPPLGAVMWIFLVVGGSLVIYRS